MTSGSLKLAPARSAPPFIATGLLLILLIFVAAPANAVTFTTHTQAGKESRWHADFNEDGREDFVVPSPGGFDVVLSNGSGSYNAPVHYSLSSGNMAIDFAIGQFMGAADIIAIDGKTGNFFVFVGKTNGTFSPGQPFPIDVVPLGIVAGDYNHDGLMDFAYSYFDSSHNSFIGVLFGGGGFFEAGPINPVAFVGDNLFVGDFDGDGKADLFTQSCGPNTCDNFVYYGDGTGHFPVTGVPPADNLAQYLPFDVNGDGKMDLIGLPFASPLSGDVYFNHIAVLYGNAGRTWTLSSIPTSRCVNGADANKVTVADFNGDGIPDIAFEEVSNCSASFPHFEVIKTGKGAGAFNSEQTFAQPGVPTANLETVRSVRNNKPDLSLTECTSSSCSGHNIVSFMDSTSGAFPTCTAPSGFPPLEGPGIHVCSPAAGSTVSPTFGVHVGAVTQTPARKVEIFVDGKKIAEQRRGSFSHYTFMDKTITLSAGSHKITIFAAGWDNWLEKTAFTVNVD